MPSNLICEQREEEKEVKNITDTFPLFHGNLTSATENRSCPPMTGRTVISAFCPLGIQPLKISIPSSTSGVRNALFFLTLIMLPPYFPDLALADFLLLPKLKSSLKGRRFQTVEEIEENSRHPAKHVPELEEKKVGRGV
jgi:hypothetical protein